MSFTEMIKVEYLLLPYRWKLLCLLIVTGKAVDSTLNQNQPEFRIFVLPIPLQVLPDGDCLLDQVIEIFRYFRSKP